MWTKVKDFAIGFLGGTIIFSTLVAVALFISGSFLLSTLAVVDYEKAGQVARTPLAIGPLLLICLCVSIATGILAAIVRPENTRRYHSME